MKWVAVGLILFLSVRGWGQEQQKNGKEKWQLGILTGKDIEGNIIGADFGYLLTESSALYAVFQTNLTTSQSSYCAVGGKSRFVQWKLWSLEIGVEVGLYDRFIEIRPILRNQIQLPRLFSNPLFAQFSLYSKESKYAWNAGLSYHF
ncbi:MAG: hypothetical protein MI784_16820 [Cytophagales bacterium]|nr:hypothetical protein [Cytophagales bacterium]